MRPVHVHAYVRAQCQGQGPIRGHPAQLVPVQLAPESLPVPAPLPASAFLKDYPNVFLQPLPLAKQLGYWDESAETQYDIGLCVEADAPFWIAELNRDPAEQYDLEALVMMEIVVRLNPPLLQLV
jgi:hypothetical protein